MYTIQHSIQLLLHLRLFVLLRGGVGAVYAGSSTNFFFFPLYALRRNDFLARFQSSKHNYCCTSYGCTRTVCATPSTTDWVSQTCTRQTLDESGMQDTCITKSRDKAYKESRTFQRKYCYKQVLLRGSVQRHNVSDAVISISSKGVLPFLNARY